MSAARAFLRDLHTAVQRSAWRPSHDPGVRAAIEDLAKAATALVRRTGAAELSFGDPVTIDGAVVDGAAIEFAGLVEGLRSRGVQVVVLVQPIDPADVEALVRIAGGADIEVPGDSVRIDDRPSIRSVVPATSFARVVTAATELVANLDTGIRLDRLAETADPLVRGSIADPDDAFARAVAAFSGPTHADHAVGVAIMAAVVGNRLGVALDDLGLLGVAAFTHDVALIVDPNVEYRDHPMLGAEAILLAGGPGHALAAAVALEHHIRADGTGFPVVGRPTHPYSWIVGAVDAFAHLISGTQRRAARTPADAMRIMAASAGRDHDPEVIAALVDAFGHRPAGSLLRLETGEVALIGGRSGRAIVLTGADGSRLEVPEPIDLVDRTIVGEVLPEAVGLEAGELPELRP